MRFALILLCASALPLAACGGDDPKDRAGPRLDEADGTRAELGG